MRTAIGMLSGLLLWLGAAQAHPDCGRVLVSGYFSTVHVFDGCSGAFQRNLDPNGRIRGAQAIRERDGLLYVVSEETQQILRYRADTLEFVDAFINTGAINPTGVDFGRDGDVYVGGYESDSVLRFDAQTGADKGVVVRAGALGLDGADNGLKWGPDGQLYVPGYDSNNVLRYNPADGQTSVFIAAGSGGLRHTRGILFEPGGQTVLISSEGSGDLLRFCVADGGFVGVFARLRNRPTGLAYNAAGEILVSSDRGNDVIVLDPQSGVLRRTLVAAGSGGLSGATFVTPIAGTTPRSGASADSANR